MGHAFFRRGSPDGMTLVARAYAHAMIPPSNRPSPRWLALVGAGLLAVLGLRALELATLDHAKSEATLARHRKLGPSAPKTSKEVP